MEWTQLGPFMTSNWTLPNFKDSQPNIQFLQLPHIVNS